MKKYKHFVFARATSPDEFDMIRAKMFINGLTNVSTYRECWEDGYADLKGWCNKIETAQVAHNDIRRYLDRN